MYYTKADAEKATKVLFFNGAGWADRGEVENCRIKTAFVNDAGEKIFLELWGVEVTKNSPERYKQYENVGIVDYCYIIVENGEKYLADIENRIFEYSKLGILNFVNENLNCSFDEIKILDVFDGYRVHKDGGGYNFIEDYSYNPERASARRKAFNNFDMQIRNKMGEKYSQMSLYSMDDKTITVRIYSSYKKMIESGMDPNNRLITIEI